MSAKQLSLRFLHLADLHLYIGPNTTDWKIMEQNKCLNFILKYAKENSVKDIIISGDIFDTHNPDTYTVGLFLHFVGDGVAQGLRFWVIPGNHDSCDKSNRFNSLSSIIKTLNIVNSDPYCGFNVFDCTQVLDQGDFSSYRIYFLPWMEDSVFSDSLKKIGKSADKIKKHGKVSILVTHCYVKGTELGDSGLKLGEGIDHKLFDPFNYVALGDVHLRQDFNTKNGVAWYPGSIFTINFGERKERKGFLDVTLDKDGGALVKAVNTPHIKWTQRRIKVSVLNKILASKTLLKRKFPKEKFRRRNVKLIVDCEGQSKSRSNLDVEKIIRFFREDLKVIDFKCVTDNVGYTRTERFKSKKTSDMIDETVDKDKSVKGNLKKKRTKKVGKGILEKEGKK